MMYSINMKKINFNAYILSYTKMTKCLSRNAYFRTSKFYHILLFLCSSDCKIFKVDILHVCGIYHWLHFFKSRKYCFWIFKHTRITQTREPKTLFAASTASWPGTQIYQNTFFSQVKCLALNRLWSNLPAKPQVKEAQFSQFPKDSYCFTWKLNSRLLGLCVATPNSKIEF